MQFQNVPPPVGFNRAHNQPYGGNQVQQIHIAGQGGQQQQAAPMRAHQGVHPDGQNANHQGFQAQWGGYQQQANNRGDAPRQENNQGRPLLGQGQQGPEAQQLWGINNGAHQPMQRSENFRYLCYGQLPPRQASASHQAGYAVGVGGYGSSAQRGTYQALHLQAVGIAPNTMRVPTLGDRLLRGCEQNPGRTSTSLTNTAFPGASARDTRLSGAMQAGDVRVSGYEFPTDHGCSFGRAMSTFASGENLRGRVSIAQGSNIDQNISNQVSQALALKMNFKTKQFANEKVLSDLLKTGGFTADLRSALQAHAAIYEESLNLA